MDKRIERQKKVVTPVRCARCGHLKGDHWALNYSNGNLMSGEVLVCPTAVFSEDK
jgi:hypothetical protein